MQAFPTWQQGERDEYPVLRGSQRADVAIVGGGLTGLTLAALLSGQGLDVALVASRATEQMKWLRFRGAERRSARIELCQMQMRGLLLLRPIES